MANPLFDSLFGIHAHNTAPFLRLGQDRALSYADFVSLSARFAHALTEVGVTPGDRVAVQVEKSAEALAVYAACVRCGAIFLPLNTAYTPDEVRYFVTDSEARLLLGDPTTAQRLSAIATEAGAAFLTLDADGGGSFSDAAASQPHSFETISRDGSDLAAFLYTSGTTGRSKGAMLTQDNLLSNARALVEAWHFTDRDVLLHALPIFHTHGLFVATNVTLLAGGSMLFHKGFDLDRVMADLPAATTMMGVPTFYTRLLSEPQFTRDLVAHMRLFVSGSAPLLEETHRQFEARSGHRILERYGMTETSMIASNPYAGERRAGTVGVPLPEVEVRVTDRDTGATLAAEEVGLIEVRGPNVFAGYWGMPEKTAAEMRDGGWFVTGDLGRMDADGYLAIVGRDKDLVISGGYNVYPKEVELALDAESGVRESAVIGVPHPDLGEAVVALVVPEDGCALDTDGLKTAVAPSLARYKQPRAIFVIDALPRNTMGKVQKAALRERFSDTFATG